MLEIIYLNLQEASYGALNVEILRVSERSPQIFNSNYSSSQTHNNHERIERDKKYHHSILEEIKKRRAQ